MYNVQPPIDVNMHHDEVGSIQIVLRDIKEMLHIAEDNVNDQNYSLILC